MIGTERRELEMTNFRQIREFGARLKGKPIDLLFCNAGISGKKGMAPGSFDFDSWEEVLRVNLLGTAALAEALLDNVAASEHKTIAMMSSRLGSIGESSGMTLPYCHQQGGAEHAGQGPRGDARLPGHHRGRAQPGLGAHRHGRRAARRSRPEKSVQRLAQA